ncbi:MAG TPA: sugar ABC transporter permease [Clostridiales bacterium]|nr:carbohydrate ABC transporter permease [Clostridia bacterium]HCS73187.1 sugar ABC transporter permease [Clostridiales bacterium]
MAKEAKHINKLTMLSKGWNAVFSIILFVIAMLVIIPVLLVAIISFSSELSIANNGYSFFPGEWTLDGYRYLFKAGDQLAASYKVTIFHSITGTAMSLAVMSMYAYVIAQRRFRYNRIFTWFLFFTMLFGGGLVPSYILNVRYLHINNTIWIFLIPGLVNAYYTIILRTFIKTTIPDSLFEAARIDGAGHFRIFISVVLPLFKAGLATIGLFSLVGRWNDWFTGMLYIQDPELVPLQTMLYKLRSTIDFLKKNAAMSGTPDGVALLRTMPDENMRMASTMAVIIPILFAYPFFQRYFVYGLTMGSIKE